MSNSVSEEILINVTPRETRVAIVENGMLQEVYVERANRRGLVGNIYKGKVSRVLPGMDAAFLDIGLDRTAFLHVSDIGHPNAPPDTPKPDGLPPPTISHLLHDGQEILVQVVKDPMGSKGARLTTQISIPSRFLVYMPKSSDGVGISQKIENEQERNRLREITTDKPGEGTFIVRTAAEGGDEQGIRADKQFLQRLWRSVQESATQVKPASLVYEDLSLVYRAMRDLVGRDVEKVRIDSRETFIKVQKFVAQFTPELVSMIEHYPGERPIFDLYGVEDEIQRALEKKIFLKSGGYLVIDQTEAMTTIDVNTGGFVGHSNLEETIFKTNLESTQAIARQLRLRNLGGIIIIDFIDMLDEEHKRQVLRALEKYLERDRAKAQISEVSSLGLVEMTRKRTRESLEHVLCETCPTCSGRGSIKSAETVCYEIFREILRAARQFDAVRFLVLASPQVVDSLNEEESTGVAELEDFIGKPIKFQAEAQYTQEQYDVVLM